MKKPTGAVFHRRAWRMSAVSTRGMPTGGCGPQRNGKVASIYSVFNDLPLVKLPHYQGNTVAKIELTPLRVALLRPLLFSLYLGIGFVKPLSQEPSPYYVGKLPTSSVPNTKWREGARPPPFA